MAKVNKTMEFKYYALYMAYLVWKLKEAQGEHIGIAAKSKVDWDAHFKLILCDIDSMRILMNTIEYYFPEIYQASGKSIRQHFDEAKEILDKHFFGRSYDKLV